MEPEAAALAGAGADRLDQSGAAAMPPRRGIHEQILQIAHLAHRPGMGMEQVMNDAGERRVIAAEPGAKAADRALRRDQPLPSELVDLGRQAGLVELEIAPPQLRPASLVGGAPR